MKMNKVASIMLGLSALVTAFVAIYFTFSATSVSLAIRLVFLALIIADTICYLTAAIGAWKKSGKWFSWAVTIVAVNMAGAIFDDIGIADISFLAYNLIILALLILENKKTGQKASLGK